MFGDDLTSDPSQHFCVALDGTSIINVEPGQSAVGEMDVKVKLSG